MFQKSVLKKLEEGWEIPTIEEAVEIGRNLGYNSSSIFVGLALNDYLRVKGLKYKVLLVSTESCLGEPPDEDEIKN